jgi:hypothetical protein
MEMSDEVQKAAQEVLRQLALLKLAMAFDAEQEVQAMHERAIRDVVEDRHINVHQLKPLASGGEPMKAEGGTIPIGPPPGIKWIDAMCDQQDALDKADLVRRLAGLPKVT